VASVEAFYGGAAPFECDFGVHAYFSATQLERTWQAHLVFVRPGELVATVEAGGGVIVRAQTLATYDPVAQQGSFAPVSAEFVPIAFAYAGGPGTLSRHLQFVGYPGTAMNAPGQDVLVGAPVEPSPDSTKLLLYVTPIGEVRRMLHITAAGDQQQWDSVACRHNVTTTLPAFFGAPPGPSTGAPRPEFLTQVSLLTRALP
jgi:hypothetical protein